MKHCSKCKKMLPFESFSVDRSRHDGRVYVCKPCRRNWKEGPKASHKLTDQQKEQACSRYVAGESLSTVGEAFGVTEQAIYSILKNRGIERRSTSESGRTYSCDHAFFDAIDNEAKAYWLGFLAADGCVFRNSIILALQTGDRSHVLRFREAIKSNHPLTDRLVRNQHRDNNPRSQVIITSPQMVTALARYSVTPRKSMTVSWPDLPFEMLRHYLRGFVDGDGGFYTAYAKSGRSWCEFSITSNEGILLSAQKFLVEHCQLGLLKLQHRPNNAARTLRYSGRQQIKRIFHLLYDGASIYLPRKREGIEPFLFNSDIPQRNRTPRAA